MKVERKWLLAIALACLGFESATPASAFDWPSWSLRGRRCEHCGRVRTILTVHAPQCPMAAQPYAPGVVPGAVAMPGAALPGAAAPGPAPTPAAPEGAAPGQPQPEGPAAVPGTEQPGQPPATTPEQPAAPTPTAPAEGAGTAPAAGLGGTLGAPQGAIAMFGDASPVIYAPIHANQLNGFTPPVPPEPPPGRNFSIPLRAAPPVPTIRSFKMADNQTAMPVNRVTFNFNFYDYVNQALNQRFNLPLSRVRAYKYAIGFEKMFLNQRASIGLRLPLDNALGNSNLPNVGNSSTAVGDLAIYLKYALLINRARGRVLSGGLAITTPTGPSSFAGASWLRGFHFTTLQPYLAFQYSWDRLYAIGFTAIDVPMDRRDVTLFYNDLSLGYFVYRSRNRNGWLQGIAPTFEAHSNTPLNHTDVFNFRDFAGSAQIVDLTEGLNFFFRNRAIISLGLVEPVTGPRPFSIEALALLNVFF